jgi:hypothetical protein
MVGFTSEGCRHAHELRRAPRSSGSTLAPTPLAYGRVLRRGVARGPAEELRAPGSPAGRLPRAGRPLPRLPGDFCVW